MADNTNAGPIDAAAAAKAAFASVADKPFPDDLFEAPQLQWLVTSGQKVKGGQPIAVVGDRETKERVVDAYAESMKRAMEAVEKMTIEAPEEKWSKSEGESEGAETVSDDVDVIDMTEEERYNAALALTSALPERAFTGEYDRLFGPDESEKENAS